MKLRLVVLRETIRSVQRQYYFCHVDCFCLQEEMEDEGEVFSVPYTEATASASNGYIEHQNQITIKR